MSQTSNTDKNSVIRRFDDLGRIVIPRIIRDEVFGTHINDGQEMEITCLGKGIILLTTPDNQDEKSKQLADIGRIFSALSEEDRSDVMHLIDLKIRTRNFIKEIETTCAKKEYDFESQITKPKLKSFIVRWHASGYAGSFRYLVVAESIYKAQEIWDKFVEAHDEIQYSWEKAKQAMQRHYGGFTDWKENGDTDKKEGCYELPFDAWNAASDHLND